MKGALREMASYTTNLNLKMPDGDEDVSILDINSNMEAIDSAVGSESVFISITALSVLPYTVSDSRITSNHRVVDMVLSNMVAMPSDWVYTTTDGSITITGTISATTDVSMQLIRTY